MYLEEHPTEVTANEQEKPSRTKLLNLFNLIPPLIILQFQRRPNVRARINAHTNNDTRVQT